MTLNGLKYIARMLGCIVCDYSKSTIMLILLDLYARAEKSKAVAVIDENGNKIIFIDDSISEQEQMFALAHELGHIALQHTARNSGKSQEIEADKFAEVLLKAVGCSGQRNF